MVILNLTEGTHTIKWTLSGYSDLVAQIRVSSTGSVSCISVTGGSCYGTSTPRISINGSTVTGYMKSSSGPTPTQTPSQYNYVRKWGSDCTVRSPMKKGLNSKGEPYYVYAPLNSSQTGYALYSFYIPKSGTYKFTGHIASKSYSNNSFYTEIDGSGKDTWDLPIHTLWTWVNISNRGNGSETNPGIPILKKYLSKGNHTFKLYNREEETWFRTLIVTDDLNCTPGYYPGAPTNSYDTWKQSKGNLKYNLSALLEIIDGYMKFKNLGFTVTLQNLLSTIDGYLGF